MKRIDVLLVNFDQENSIQPWYENDTLYTIYTGRKIKDLEQNYRNCEFNLIFFKTAKTPAEDIQVLKYMKSVFSGIKIIAVSESPNSQKAFEYTKYGAYDIHEMFTGLFDFINTLKKYSKSHNGDNSLNSRYVKYRNSTRNNIINPISAAVTVTNTVVACLINAKGEQETLQHMDGVGQYARLITEKIFDTKGDNEGYSLKYAEYIYLGSKLHDIGKINIPDGLIKKPTSLTKQEFEVVKTHTHYGYEMLAGINQIANMDLSNFLKIAKEIVLFHHENYDGTGYPNGLKGKKIPLSGRICALADTYDALSSDRIYRKAFTHKTTCDLILNKEKYKYDPDVLEIFSEYNEQFEEINLVYKRGRKMYPKSILRKQCAWCKSLFLFNKWLPYNETVVDASHGVCPKCSRIIRREIDEK